MNLPIRTGHYPGTSQHPNTSARRFQFHCRKAPFQESAEFISALGKQDFFSPENAAQS
ncbi:hypothetical protein [Pseudomonas sp. DTU12.1]|uniref:hypothetical protein n=1 Tax=Pseudomonas sp. DTU12.1 TaxID=2654238 RepID=UPI001C49C5F1|nr:hypothetical protein [Pseudomonas sp. DTU12.1]